MAIDMTDSDALSEPTREDAATVTTSASPAMQSDLSYFAGFDETVNIMSTDGACAGAAS